MFREKGKIFLITCFLRFFRWFDCVKIYFVNIVEHWNMVKIRCFIDIWQILPHFLLWSSNGCLFWKHRVLHYGSVQEAYFSQPSVCFCIHWMSWFRGCPDTQISLLSIKFLVYYSVLRFDSLFIIPQYKFFCLYIISLASKPI